jgi:hypothetical protein
MISFLDIDVIRLPRACIEDVYNHIRNAGTEGVEGVALWAGSSSGKIFTIQTAIIPKQTAYKRKEGLLYTVDGDELHTINVWLYQHKLTLIAQVHSHLGKAYHSETDDLFPIVTQVGCLSVVIPNFGFDNFSLDSWAVYRLLPGEGWKELRQKDVASLIKIID